MASGAAEPRGAAEYDREKGILQAFLMNFKCDVEGEIVRKYAQCLQKIADREERKLEVHLDDLHEYLEGTGEGPALAEAAATNTLHYSVLLAEAADAVMPQPSLPPGALEDDVFDELNRTRERNEMLAATGQLPGALEDTSAMAEGAAKHRGLPAALLRRYDVYILPQATAPVLRMRSVNSAYVGKLVRVRGLVTTVSDVKPLASVVTYTDEATGHELYQEVVGRSFMPLDAADTALPGRKKSLAPPVMQTRGSKFVKFQEARIQEVASEVPEGDTPRTLKVHLRGDITRSLKAGDDVTLAAVFLPEPFTGWRAMRAGLLSTTYLDAQGVCQNRAAYAADSVTSEQVAAIEALGAQGQVFERLAASIAPEIYGHRDVKKVLLLQMVGGVSRSFPDGVRLRGDVHVCLMGDPGVAKSQLLKYVAKVAPRAVYTTGKGSSGVGLTAAVLRNQVTKELVLEGGALVLADKGICCIDEFDKMEEADRTYIHEVMEQQTVSIAKAGITTTLNTRTSILAAANPSYGRWNHKRSPADNINMPPALLSRFDVMWLMLDRRAEEADRSLAEHIVSLHQGSLGARPEGLEVLPPALLRAYISLARTHSPHVPPGLCEYICGAYVALRQRERDEELIGEGGRSYVTPRTLMSILRLSQAVAKLRFDSVVSRGDVDSALALLRASQASIEPEAEARLREDPISRCYRAVRDYAERSRSAEVSWARIQELMIPLNVQTADIQKCVSDYEAIAVWTVLRDAGTNQVTGVQFHEGDLALAGGGGART